MTLPERRELRAWVAVGNSVHANPGLYAYENGNEMDYLDAMRFEDKLFEMHQEMKNNRYISKTGSMLPGNIL